MATNSILMAKQVIQAQSTAVALDDDQERNGVTDNFSRRQDRRRREEEAPYWSRLKTQIETRKHMMETLGSDQGRSEARDSLGGEQQGSEGPIAVLTNILQHATGATLGLTGGVGRSRRQGRPVTSGPEELSLIHI